MNWDEAYKKLVNGKTVYRKAWKANSRIYLANSKFVQFVSIYGYKAWSPYYKDFSANDWEVFDGKTKKQSKPWNPFKRFACWIGWHGTRTHLYMDGCSVHARCDWCGYKGMIDSNGDLF